MSEIAIRILNSEVIKLKEENKKLRERIAELEAEVQEFYAFKEVGLSEYQKHRDACIKTEGIKEMLNECNSIQGSPLLDGITPVLTWDWALDYANKLKE